MLPTVFNKSTYTKKKAMLVKKGIYLPLDNSAAASNHSFLLRLYTENVALVTIHDAKSCPLVLEVPCSLTPYATYVLLAKEKKCKLSQMDKIYGFSSKTLPDQAYMLHLLYKLNPSHFVLLVYGKARKVDVTRRMEIEGEIDQDAVMMYAPNMLNNVTRTLVLTNEEEAIMKSYNKNAEIIRITEYDIPDIGKRLEKVGHICMKFKELKLFQQKVLQNFVIKLAPMCLDWKTYKASLKTRMTTAMIN